MLSKKQKHKKLRPKPPKNKRYLARLHAANLPCFSCGRHGYIELHHVKEYSSDRKDDTKVIPLCGNDCHRNGTELSAHGTPKMFRKVFPIVTQLQFAGILFNRYKDER